MSLALFSILVVLPALGALLFIWTLVLFAIGARALDAVGALEPAAYSGAMHFTGAILAISWRGLCLQGRGSNAHASSTTWAAVPDAGRSRPELGK